MHSRRHATRKDATTLVTRDLTLHNRGSIKTIRNWHRNTIQSNICSDHFTEEEAVLIQQRMSPAKPGGNAETYCLTAHLQSKEIREDQVPSTLNMSLSTRGAAQHMLGMKRMRDMACSIEPACGNQEVRDGVT